MVSSSILVGLLDVQTALVHDDNMCSFCFMKQCFPRLCKSVAGRVVSVFTMPKEDGISKGDGLAAGSKLPVAFYDPDFNARNSWFLYRTQYTFGRWWRKDGVNHFVSGNPPSPSPYPQPRLDLFSWTEFFSNGAKVRVRL